MVLKENGPETSCSCGNRRFCDLLHVRNYWAYNLKEMTVRHNMIQEVLVEAIKKHRKISTEKILVNKEIDFGRFRNALGKPSLIGGEVKQRPDIIFWANISKDDGIIETWKLFMIEISEPFGKGDKEDVHSNTFKSIIEFKTKYTEDSQIYITKLQKNENFFSPNKGIFQAKFYSRNLVNNSQI